MSGAAPGTLSASIGGTRLLAGRLHAARQNGMGFFGAPPAGQEVMFQDLTETLAALSCRALQRQDGRSVGVRAPGMFMAMLRRKAASAGGKVVEFPAHRANPFQVCHGCGTIHKKPLSLRVHACACGVEMQRDLDSAFLARCVREDNRLHVDLARERWSGAEPLLRAVEIRSIFEEHPAAVPHCFDLQIPQLHSIS